MIATGRMLSGELENYFPEFAGFLSDCKFRSCLHDQDRDCGVSAAVQAGVLDEGRYKRYLSFLHEARERDKGRKPS